MKNTKYFRSEGLGFSDSKGPRYNENKLTSKHIIMTFQNSGNENESTLSREKNQDKYTHECTCARAHTHTSNQNGLDHLDSNTGNQNTVENCLQNTDGKLFPVQNPTPSLIVRQGKESRIKTFPTCQVSKHSPPQNSLSGSHQSSGSQACHQIFTSTLSCGTLKYKSLWTPPQAS